MKASIAIAAVAGLATAANAQFFEMVINTAPNDGPNYAQGTTIEYSLYLDNTSGNFTDFAGWSSFAGFTSAPGSHNLPVETATQTSAGAWEGRRPPSTAGFPGGSAGGFRFSPQTYTAIPNGLAGSSAANAYEGLAASVPLGGFLQDPSPRLEVFRGSFIADVLGDHTLSFNPVDAAYFQPGFSSTVIGVQSQMGIVGADYTVVPAPASLALLGLGGLAHATGEVVDDRLLAPAAEKGLRLGGKREVNGRSRRGAEPDVGLQVHVVRCRIAGGEYHGEDVVLDFVIDVDVAVNVVARTVETQGIFIGAARPAR